jgi:hypothetical protein
MGVIFEINRDFPFQVPLSFDEVAMNVLDWLEECAFEWDMYVDLRASTVRYCFRNLEDAAAFRRRFIDARKGELSPAAIDRNWQHQVVLPARACEGEFCKDLSLCNRGHAVRHDNEWYHVYCFSEPDDAEKFKQRFGGEKFNPNQRGRGRHWARWNKL